MGGFKTSNLLFRSHHTTESLRMVLIRQLLWDYARDHPLQWTSYPTTTHRAVTWQNMNRKFLCTHTRTETKGATSSTCNIKSCSLRGYYDYSYLRQGRAAHRRQPSSHNPTWNSGLLSFLRIGYDLFFTVVP